MLGPWLTTGDVAAYFKVHVQTVRRWVRSGALPSRRSPSGWSLFTTEDVLAMVPPSALPRPAQVWDRGCMEDGCEGSHHAKFLCKTHYQRMYQRRRLERVYIARRIDLEDTNEL